MGGKALSFHSSSGVEPAEGTLDWWDFRFPSAYLHQVYDYDPATGLFRHASRETVGKCRFTVAGRPALLASKRGGYLGGLLDGRVVLAHRVAWAMSRGSWPRVPVVHLNGNLHDNRLCNLSIQRHR